MPRAAAGDDRDPALRCVLPCSCHSSSSRRVSRGDEDVLLLGERVRGVRAELAAEAGLLEAAERRPVAHRGVRVDAEVAGLDAARDPQRPAEVAGEDRAGQPVLGVVGQRDGLAPRRRTASPRPPGRRPPRARSGSPGRRSAPRVGGSQKPGAVRAPTRERDLDLVEVGRAPVAAGRAEISGPISRRLVARGRATRIAGDRRLEPAEELVVRRRARPGSASGRSSPGRRCRRRRTARVAAAAAMSASAKTMLALLPPSSRVTRFTWSAQPRHDLLADLGRAGEADLAHDAGASTNRCADHRALARACTVNTPSGSPASSASSPSRIAVSGVSSAGLSTTVLPAASAGAKPQPAIGIGKFHGTITPTTPSGSWKVMSTPPATGICRPKSRSGARGVVVAGSRGRCRPPSGRCRWCGRRCAPRAAASSSTCASTTAANRRSSRARSPGATSRQAGNAPLRRARSRRRSPSDGRRAATSATGSLGRPG